MRDHKLLEGLKKMVSSSQVLTANLLSLHPVGCRNIYIYVACEITLQTTFNTIHNASSYHVTRVNITGTHIAM